MPRLIICRLQSTFAVWPSASYMSTLSQPAAVRGPAGPAWHWQRPAATGVSHVGSMAENDAHQVMHGQSAGRSAAATPSRAPARKAHMCGAAANDSLRLAPSGLLRLSTLGLPGHSRRIAADSLFLVFLSQPQSAAPCRPRLLPASGARPACHRHEGRREEGPGLRRDVRDRPRDSMPAARPRG
jgi:hypothetical protein